MAYERITKVLGHTQNIVFCQSDQEKSSCNCDSFTPAALVLLVIVTFQFDGLREERSVPLAKQSGSAHLKHCGGTLLNIAGLGYSVAWSCSHVWLGVECTGHWEIVAQLSYGDCPAVDVLHNIIPATSRSRIWTPVSEGEPLVWGSCQAHSGGHKFTKIPIFRLKAQILSLAINIMSCFYWSDRLTLFTLEDCLPDAQVGGTTVGLLVILSNKSGGARGKPWFLLTVQQPRRCLSWLHFRRQRSALRVNLIPSHSIADTHSVAEME